MESTQTHQPAAADEVLLRIQNEYAERRAKNVLYSLRAFARDLGMSQTLLTLLIQKKRRLTAKQFDKISSLLHFNPIEAEGQRKRLSKKSVNQKSDSKLNDSVESEIKHLEIEQFRLISQWYHLALVALASTQNYRPDTSFIARELKISQAEAASALERVIQLKLLGEDGYPLKKSNGTHARFVTAKSSPAVRNYHLSMIDKAKAQLDQTDQASFESRSIRGLSLAFDSSQIDEAKAELVRFEQSFTKKFTRKNLDSVYQLNLQFFALTASHSNRLERTKK